MPDFRSLSWPARYLLLRVVLLVAVMRLGLAFFSFRAWRRFVLHVASLLQTTQPTSSKQQQRLLWAVETAASGLLADRACLTQAMAAEWLLARRGLVTHLQIGVAKGEDGRLQAHAWLEQDGRILIGGSDSPQQFTPLPSLDKAL